MKFTLAVRLRFFGALPRSPQGLSALDLTKGTQSLWNPFHIIMKNPESYKFTFGEFLFFVLDKEILHLFGYECEISQAGLCDDREVHAEKYAAVRH